MPKIYSYKKVTDLFTTHALLEPEIADNAAKVMELCTIDGITYILVPDGVVLPVQSDQVQASLRLAILTPELIEQIKTASPYMKLTAARMSGKTNKVRYSKQDEIQLNQMSNFLNPTELTPHIAEFRTWATDIKIPVDNLD